MTWRDVSNIMREAYMKQGKIKVHILPTVDIVVHKTENNVHLWYKDMERMFCASAKYFSGSAENRLQIRAKLSRKPIEPFQMRININRGDDDIVPRCYKSVRNLTSSMSSDEQHNESIVSFKDKSITRHSKATPYRRISSPLVKLSRATQAIPEEFWLRNQFVCEPFERDIELFGTINVVDI